MAYRLRYTLNIDIVPDGAGAMSVPSAQTIGFAQTSGGILVPGYTFANPPTTPTLANFYTAMTNVSTAPAASCMALDLGTQINAALTRIQNFQIGGG